MAKTQAQIHDSEDGKTVDENKPKDSFVEDEQTRLRDTQKDSQKDSSEKEEKTEEETKEVKKVSYFIMIIDSLHFCALTLCMFLVIHFYCKYTDLKDNEFNQRASHREFGKMVLCIVLAIFFAVSKGVLIGNYSN